MMNIDEKPDGYCWDLMNSYEYSTVALSWIYRFKGTGSWCRQVDRIFHICLLLYVNIGWTDKYNYNDLKTTALLKKRVLKGYYDVSNFKHNAKVHIVDLWTRNNNGFHTHTIKADKYSSHQIIFLRKIWNKNVNEILYLKPTC